MKIDAEALKIQVSSLLTAYPGLKLIESTAERIRVQGSIFVNQRHNDFTVRKEYDIEIVLPVNNHELPYVVDINDQVEYGYHHRYTNGRLCLSTDADFQFRFLDGFEILAWMDEFVELYFFSYEYYRRYKEFPFGERHHGYIGILESYQDRLHTSDGSETFNVMINIATKPYRGHQPCPCGSGNKVRDCHGDTMRGFYEDARKIDILKKDLYLCISEMEEYRKRWK